MPRKSRCGASSWASAELIAFHLPMHTATRLAGPVIAAARAAEPGGAHLRVRALRAAQRRVAARRSASTKSSAASSKRSSPPGPTTRPEGTAETAKTAEQRFLSGLCGSAVSSGRDRCRGFIFSSPIAPGCRRCRSTRRCSMPDGDAADGRLHRGEPRLPAPVPALPGRAGLRGQFRVVQPEVVLADVAAQVAAGARHITFGDPDFFNGPTHAMRIVDGAARGASRRSATTSRSRSSTCCSIATCCRGWRATGCAFVTSAVESIDDRGAGGCSTRDTRAPISWRRWRSAAPPA